MGASMDTDDRQPGVTELFCEFFRGGQGACIATVTLPSGSFEAEVVADGAGLSVIATNGGFDAEAGEPVCVECGEGGAVRFYSEVSAKVPGGVRTSFPYAVEAPRRRRLRRVSVAEKAGFEFVAHGGRRVALADLSAGGTCLVDPADTAYAVGDQVSGSLHLPRMSPIPCELTVRHVGLRHGSLRVGVEFTEITLRDRMGLMNVLRGLGAEHDA